jgi:hypothetical protein
MKGISKNSATALKYQACESWALKRRRGRSQMDM